jgi:hypothetical protein
MRLNIGNLYPHLQILLAVEVTVVARQGGRLSTILGICGRVGSSTVSPGELAALR